MRKFAILTLLALELVVSGCGNNTPNTRIATTTNTNWLAQLSGGTGQASELNFETQFSVTTFSGTSAPLDVNSLRFLNQGMCFGNGQNNETVGGQATLTVSSTNKVTGSMTMTVASTLNSNVLTLTSPDGGVTGTTNGSPGVLGTLSNGVVVGTWSLSSSDTNCIPSSPASGAFIMCQNPNSQGVCVPPA